MGDLKLFRVNDDGVEELEGHSVTIVKTGFKIDTIAG